MIFDEHLIRLIDELNYNLTKESMAKPIIEPSRSETTIIDATKAGDEIKKPVTDGVIYTENNNSDNPTQPPPTIVWSSIDQQTNRPASPPIDPVTVDKPVTLKFEKESREYKLYDDSTYVGRCVFSLNNCYGEDTVYISWLGIEEVHRGKGYGTVLLYEVLKDAYEKHNRKRVRLEDASDRSGQTDSIYYGMGLTYIQNDGTMYGNIRHILYGKKRRVEGYYDKVTGPSPKRQKKEDPVK